LAGSFTAMFLALPAPISSRGDAQGRRMAEDETDEVPKLPPDARLESLDERLDRMQQAEDKRNRRQMPDASYRAGQAVLSNLVGAPAGGFIIGFVLDKALGTKPWLMLAMLFAGFAVGVWNVFRIANNPSGKRPDA
jgi:ATP synthase protein I